LWIVNDGSLALIREAKMTPPIRALWTPIACKRADQRSYKPEVLQGGGPAALALRSREMTLTTSSEVTEHPHVLVSVRSFEPSHQVEQDLAAVRTECPIAGLTASRG
jgi:hypothetical protein